MAAKKVAIITGVLGQDGGYLAEFLLQKGYKVIGIKKRSNYFNKYLQDYLFQLSSELGEDLIIEDGDLTDTSNINALLIKYKPDEIYNLAAMSYVHDSFIVPEYTTDTDATGCLRILEATKNLGYKNTKIYQASSSEMFGASPPPQNEETIFHPRSPYGVAKVYSYHIIRNYRESYDLFASNGILFNHESPRRPEYFVTRKISANVARLKLNQIEKFSLGNLDAKRDWGFAGDYVKGMWMILNHESPDDFVLATGEAYSVRDFVNLAFESLDIDIVWEGTGLDEKAIEKSSGRVFLDIDKAFFRPSEVDYLLGDYSKAKNIIGWEPEVKIKDLVKMMVEADFSNFSK